jgi:hypothetical protein
MLPIHPLLSWKRFILAILLFAMLNACAPAPAPAAPAPPTPAPLPTSTLPSRDPALTDDQVATLSSLEQLDDFPLYTLHYRGSYPPARLTGAPPPLAETITPLIPAACQANWGCALFAALGDPASRLYGRNYDWRFSPAVLLFTDPPDGYASVTMVDIEYLGFGGSRATDLLTLPLSQRKKLLDAPAWPFDGMNEQGLVVGMAAVPPGEMPPDPHKKTIDELAVMREILDHAGTLDEAIRILSGYNIDMGNVPLHYLVASAGGESALVEFYQGKLVIFRNENPWQVATNFLVASTGGSPQGQCPRYDRISQRLQAAQGRLAPREALSLLADVAQGDPQAGASTQWSVVYDMTGGDVHIIMGRKYSEAVHTLHLGRSGQ